MSDKILGKIRNSLEEYFEGLKCWDCRFVVKISEDEAVCGLPIKKYTHIEDTKIDCPKDLLFLKLKRIVEGEEKK